MSRRRSRIVAVTVSHCLSLSGEGFVTIILDKPVADSFSAICEAKSMVTMLVRQCGTSKDWNFDCITRGH